MAPREGFEIRIEELAGITKVSLIGGVDSYSADALKRRVGPICESGDTFASARPLPPMKPGDLVAFGSAGAYGAVMSSAYNSRPPAPEVLVSGDRFAVVRDRPAMDDLIRQERIPDWMANWADAPPATRGAA